MAKIVGIDLGTQSIGVAYLDTTQQKILDLKVQVFPLGKKLEKDQVNESSKSQLRRIKRGVRRNLFRKKLRKKILIARLMEHGMCPLSEEAFLVWKRGGKFPQAELAGWFQINPYNVRKQALNEKISLEQLGRVFYQISLHRGFLSNSLQDDDEENSKIFYGDEEKIGIKATEKEVEGKNTLGSYLETLQVPQNVSYQQTKKPRIRGRYTKRQMYIDEFRKIWENQKKYHPLLHDNLLKDSIGGIKSQGDSKTGILFFQRPLRSQKHLIGKCRFEKKKPRCSASHPVAELCRIWQFVLTITCNREALSREEKEKLVALLLSSEKKKFLQLRKAIKKEGSTWLFNYEDDDEILGSKTIRQMLHKELFGNKWWQLTQEEQHQIWHAAFSFTDKEKLKSHLVNKWKLTPFQINRFLKVKLKKDYGNLSLKVLRLLLPYLKKGFLYHEAMLLAGVQNSFGERWEHMTLEQKENLTLVIKGLFQEKKAKKTLKDRLETFLKKNYHLSTKQLSKLYHHSQPYKTATIVTHLDKSKGFDKIVQTLRNPIVASALFALRRIYNAMVDLHGPPDCIRIELARELKLPKKERIRIRKQQKDNRDCNARAKKALKELNQPVTPSNILRYKLWEELEIKKCPYTGEDIKIDSSHPNNLFTSYWQIEHIIPFSRSMNDSFTNKTICQHEENLKKGNQLPSEFYLQKGKEYWEEKKQLAKNILPRTKYKKFIAERTSQDLAASKLNDTRYMSRKARELLQQVCKKVEVSTGGLTSYLRRIWDLNELLQPNYKPDSQLKNRNDHRHHALDALVIALSSYDLFRQLTRWSQKSYYQPLPAKEEKKNYFPIPWEDFKLQTSRFLKTLLVQHHQPQRVLNKRKYVTYKNGKKYENMGIAARGGLHEESFLGAHISGFNKNGDPSYAYHIRKKLSNPKNFKKSKDLDKIVDFALKKHIIDYLNTQELIDKKGNIKPGAFYTKKYNLSLPGSSQHLREIPIDNRPKNKKAELKLPIDDMEASTSFLQPIEKIKTRSQVERITDAAIKKVVKERIEQIGGYVNGKSVPSGAFWEWIPAIYLPNRKGGDPVPVRKVRIKKKISNPARINEEHNKFVETSNNHHILLYKDVDGKQKGVSATFWETVLRVKNKLPIYQLPEEDKKGKIMYSLHKGDLFLLTNYLAEEIDWKDKSTLFFLLYKVVRISEKDIYFLHHSVANIENKEGVKVQVNCYKFRKEDPFPLSVRSSPSKLKGIKVKMDHFGNLQPTYH